VVYFNIGSAAGLLISTEKTNLYSKTAIIRADFSTASVKVCNFYTLGCIGENQHIRFPAVTSYSPRNLDGPVPFSYIETKNERRTNHGSPEKDPKD